MIATVPRRNGQSIYDLCLQVYGTLDLLVKFCNDNGVTNTALIPPQVDYVYDTTLVKIEGNKNIYVTGSTPIDLSGSYLTEDSSQYYITEDGTQTYVPEGV